MLHWIKNTFAKQTNTVEYQPNTPNKLDLKVRPAVIIKSMADITSIGILTYFNNENTYKAIFDLKKTLETNGKEVDVLGFVNNPTVPSIIKLNHFCQADLQQNLLPKSPKVDRFMAKKFDAMLQIFSEDIIPLKYIASQNNALVRYGVYKNYLLDAADILINCPDNNDTNTIISEILNNIQHAK